MPIPRSDYALLESYFDKHYDFLYRMARTLLYQSSRTYADAADIVQEVFLTAINKWDDFTRSKNPVGWLVETTRNKCRNHLRAVKSQQNKANALSQKLLNEQPLSYGKLYDSATEPDTSEQDLLNLLEEKLSVDDFSLIRARYLENLSFQEISQQTGISEGALRLRLHRIRKNISKFSIFLVTFFLSQNI